MRTNYINPDELKTGKRVKRDLYEAIQELNEKLDILIELTKEQNIHQNVPRVMYREPTIYGGNSGACPPPPPPLPSMIKSTRPQTNTNQELNKNMINIRRQILTELKQVFETRFTSVLQSDLSDDE